MARKRKKTKKTEKEETVEEKVETVVEQVEENIEIPENNDNNFMITSILDKQKISLEIKILPNLF